jgi:hypothetical protein
VLEVALLEVVDVLLVLVEAVTVGAVVVSVDD